MKLFNIFKSKNKLIGGDVVSCIDNTKVEHHKDYIDNIVCYDDEKQYFKQFKLLIDDYIDFITKNRKSENDIKIETIGLVNSKSYKYLLDVFDEDSLKFIDIYKKKYPNTIYIPEKIILDSDYIKIKKNNFNNDIPNNILDVIYKFKIDSFDYKVYEIDYYSKHRKMTPSIFTYDEIRGCVSDYWRFLKEKYLSLLDNNEIVFLPIENNNILSDKLKRLNISNYELKEYYSVEKDFFFIKKETRNCKKSFKDFIKTTENICYEHYEYFVLQPIKGGYLLIGNW